MSSEINDRTNIRLTLVWSLVAAAITLTGSAYKMRIDTLEAVDESVRRNIHELRIEQQAQLKYYVTREEYLIEKGKTDMTLAEMEAKRESQYFALRELIASKP